MDALDMVVDEVALEGLDGITAESLWIRLQSRQPAFPLPLDSPTKEFLFQFLISNEELTFYLLPKRREPVTLYDRFLELDPDTGIQEVSGQSWPQRDVYPASVVQDDPRGIQGSCLYYTQREDISHLIRTETRTPRVTLQQAQDRWENKLVVVASQQVRYRALIGSEGNPELKLGDLTYCILERLGRARWQGEIQRDLHSDVFKLDAGKIHYLRKSLDKNQLITTQSHVVRLPSGTQQHSILLMLKRFHIDRRNKYDILMELTSNMLSELPNHTGIMLKLRDQLNIGERTFKRVYQYMQAAKLVSVVTVPLHILNPDAGPFKTKKGTDINVRCLKLLKPYKRNQVEDEDDDDNDEDGDAPVRRNPRAQARDIERDLLTQAYEMVVRSGAKGISQRELRGLLNIGRLESRMVCRVLLRNNMIKGFMEDEGRQRTTKYIGNQFVEESKLSLNFTKERERSEKLQAPQSIHHIPPEPEPEAAQEIKTPLKRKRPYGKSSKLPLRHSTPLRENPAAGCKSPSGTLDLRGLEEKEAAPLDQDVTQEVPADHAPSETSQSQTGIEVFEEDVSKPEKSGRRKSSRDVENVTYRLLKRRNIIIEAVRSLKVIEGLYTLQKKLVDDEKMDGVSTRVCKKSVLRLVLTLARDGFLKLYRTTVLQDGVSKKVELVVHPSITPDDPLVKSAIEQVRFKISSSYTVVRLKMEEERAKAAAQEPVKPEAQVSRAEFQGQTEKKMGVKDLKNFKPTIVPGLSRSLGFQPKMPRLRILHTFLWYVIYGHPLHDAAHGGGGAAGTPSPDPKVRLQDESQSVCEEAEGVQESSDSTPGSDPEQFRVYVNEVTWRRFIPVMMVHKEYTRGWALISDLLISLPLSVFIQIIQVSYKVEGLEEYLRDPIKQHYLIKFLPCIIKKQLLYSRRYLFSFYENLQKLCYIGLMQFGPSEKFIEKDQCFIYLKKQATVVDTTVCEPHYNQAMASRPFERRRYTFSSLQDVESYWFDLLCVCLNTPLGVIRPRGRSGERHGEQEGEEPEVSTGRIRYETLQYTLKGSTEVVDDGIIPGDGLGAGGLDSSLFGHLKRNWVWTTNIVNKPRKNEDSYTVRLRNLLSKHSFPKSVCAAILNGGPLASRGVLEEEVRMGVEPSTRNLQVRGGKKQKRKRLKKEVIKPPKKKRKGKDRHRCGSAGVCVCLYCVCVSVVSVKKQNLCHDETDKKALMRMTKQRVTWTHLEDSVLILCRLASHFLNRKIKKPFVGWNVVRDILHRELELSLDKTSLAVGRRSRYIMKNPQTHLNYRVCLAEVYQDKALVENFMNKSHDYSDPAVCAEEFNELVGALRTKFSSSCGSSDVIIPNTKEELFHKFKVYSISEDPSGTREQLSSVKHIHSVVLHNLIQSTLVLSNSQMNAARAFQSFSLFSQYKQDELLQVFLDCKRRGLLNRRRARQHLAIKKTRAVPFLPMSYQLSQHYYRFFTWRFPSSLCNEVYDLLEALRQKPGVDRPNTFSFQRDEGPAESREGGDRSPGAATEGEGGAGANSAPPTDVEEMLVFPVDAPGGATACCLALMTLGLVSVDVSVPQQIVVVDSTLVDNEVVKSISRELDEEDEDEGGGVRVEVKASQASHTNYLLMKGFFVPGIISLRNITSTEHIAVNSCTLHLHLRHTPTHTLFTQRDSVFSSCSAPPSFLTRMFNLQHAGGRSFLESHAPVLNYTEMDVKAVQDLIVAVETEAELGIDLHELYRRYAFLEQVEEGRSRNLHQYVQDLLESEQMVEVGAVVPRVVSMCFAAPWLLRCPKVSEAVRSHPQHAPPIINDITAETTPSTCDVTDQALPMPPSLKRPLEQPDDIIAPPTKKPHMDTDDPAEVTLPAGDLNEEVGGVTGPLGPSTSEGGAELEVSPPGDGLIRGQCEMAIAWAGGAQNVQLPEERAVGFVARPWRSVDGSLNRPVCKGMLESVLLQIMTHPGVPEPTLLKHYSGVLQPTVIMDLLKVLVGAGCVRKRFMVSPCRASLFSSPAPPVLREELGVMEAAPVFYEPTVDCCLRLCQIFPHETNWNRWVQLCTR